MSKTNYAGIDYSGPSGTCNRDAETGIRYGIISVNTLHEFVWDKFEPDYGSPHCPKCGNEAVDANTLKSGDALESWERAKYECEDHACVNCEYIFGSESAFGDEPISHDYDHDGYQARIDSSNDVWVFKSPYFTYAQFCSPCAPGACYLSSPLAEPTSGNKCYCLGHDWFDGVAPYDVYSVETGERVEPVK